MAYDYDKVKAGYEALSPEKQKQFDQMNRNDANYQSFITRYNQEKSSANSTPTNPSYKNQGAGNYVYNEQSKYYENQTDTANNTANQDFNKKSEPIKQEGTVVNTNNEVKQEGQLKPLSQEYYNQTSDEAQNKIRANLNGYRQTNPELFSTYEDFKKNFSYDARDEVQKQTLDNWYTGYEKSMQLSAIPTTDLYTQYKDGSISLSDLESLRISNPAKYAELQEQINKGNIISAYDDDKGTGTTGMNIQEMAYNAAVQMFTKFMSGDTSSGASQIFREYEQKMDDPEMLALSDNCTEIDEQRENIQADIDSMKKQVEAEYEGTGASRAKINAIIADRTYDLQLQLRTLNSEYNKYATQYNNRMQQYQTEFNMQLQEYQINQNERQTQMKELGFALDLMNFETNDQKQEREWNYWVKQQEYKNGNINSKDYQTRYKAALTSVQNLLSQYEGIPMQRSAEQMAQDILTAIDGGSDLGAELTKINQQIQQKDEYKYLYNNTYGKGNDIKYNTFKLGDQEYIVYNNELMTSDEFNKKYGGVKSKANYTVVSPDKLKYYGDGRANSYESFINNPKYDDDKYIGECGKFVNKYLEEIGAGKLFGNEDIETRKDWTNSDEGKVGTVAVFDYNHKSSDGINHGHVAIVVSAPDKNGNFWVKDANFNSDGKIQTRKVNLKDASLKGFIDPTKDQNGNSGVSLSSTGSSSPTVSTNSNGTISLGTTKLTPSQFDEYVKKYIDGTVSYSEVKSLGDDALNKVTQRALQLGEEGYTPSTKIIDPNKQASLESSLRKEYDKLTEDANATINWVQKMDDAYAQVDTDLNAASQALVIAYNKILDESSVVREGEYARTAEGQSLLNQMGAKIKQITQGGAGITKDQLKSLVDMAHTFSRNAESYRDEMAQRAKVSIDKYGLTPEAVLPMNVLNKIQEGSTQDWAFDIPEIGGTNGGMTSTTGGFDIPQDWSNSK